MIVYLENKGNSTITNIKIYTDNEINKIPSLQKKESLIIQLDGRYNNFFQIDWEFEQDQYSSRHIYLDALFEDDRINLFISENSLRSDSEMILIEKSVKK